VILIDDKIVSDHLLESYFICDLTSCKGACCWEGDYGAPLEESEIDSLINSYDSIRPYLTQEGQEVIAQKGVYQKYNKDAFKGTTLLENGACAFMHYNELGIAQCGIEKAWKNKDSNLQKPISCHLYPVRIKEHDSFVAVNYDEWSICSAACKKGAKEKVPLYQFAKDALIRKFGMSFYTQLHELWLLNKKK